MPLYDYKCYNCNKTVEVFKKLKDYDREEFCTKCNELMALDLTNSNKRDWFRPGEVWEHIGSEPIVITSKKHLREECAKRGVQARCLL